MARKKTKGKKGKKGDKGRKEKGEKKGKMEKKDDPERGSNSPKIDEKKVAKKFEKMEKIMEPVEGVVEESSLILESEEKIEVEPRSPEQIKEDEVKEKFQKCISEFQTIEKKKLEEEEELE